MRRLGGSLFPPLRVCGTQASASPPCSVEGSSFGKHPRSGFRSGAWGWNVLHKSLSTHLWTMSQAGSGTSAGHICRAHHLKKSEIVKSMVLSAFLTWTHPIICPTPPHPKFWHHRHLFIPRLPCAVIIDQFYISPPHTSFLTCLSHTNACLLQAYLEMWFNHWLQTSICSVYLHLSDLWSEIITMNYLSPCTLWALCCNSSRWTYFTCSSLP